MPPRVLIAEDDRVIANAMATHLRRAGMEVEVAEDGDRAIAKLRFERPDVAVVDLMLPGMDGWRITETLRAEGIETPIVIVSARGSEHDKVHALGIGGDDYLRQAVRHARAGGAGGGGAAPGRDDAGPRPRPPIEVEGLVIDPEPARRHARRRGRGPDADRSSGCCTCWRRSGQGAVAATSSSSGCGGCRTATATVPSTSASASCATRSTAAPTGHTYIQTHYGVGYRFEPVARA